MADPPDKIPPEQVSDEENLAQLQIFIEEFMLQMRKLGFDVTRDIIDIRTMLMINISCVMQKGQ